MSGHLENPVKCNNSDFLMGADARKHNIVCRDANVVCMLLTFMQHLLASSSTMLSLQAVTEMLLASKTSVAEERLCL